MNKVGDQINVVRHYVPDAAIPILSKYFNYWKVNVVTVPRRNTKHGDFKILSQGVHCISVNNSSNPYRSYYTNSRNCTSSGLQRFRVFYKPHGKEWKSCYRN